jgi:hypothetical protein
LKNNSIFWAFRTCIHSYLGKGLWLIIMSSICSFCIAHSTFISKLHFHLALHILLSFQSCIFILDWFNFWHLVFSHVSVSTSWTRLTCI